MKNRLKEDLIESGKFGRISQKRIKRYKDLDRETGVNRPEGSEANRQLREFVIDRMKDAELEVFFDKFGNIFGRKEGSKTCKNAVMCGSHLDSVANGGQFDGALGVFAAIDAVRRLRDQGFVNERPIEVVVFAGEEGSTFNISLLGSSALVGKLSETEVLSTRNAKDQTLEDVLMEIGHLGNAKRDFSHVDYFLELHIEQGPILFSERIPIGIVETITGVTWVVATIRGVENHAGTTPMKMRKDALAAGAEVVTFVRDRAIKMTDEQASSTVGTVGRLDVFPNGINIVPGKVELGIDIRDVSVENMDQLKDEVISFLKGLELRYGMIVDVQIAAVHSPVALSQEIISVIESSARTAGIAYKKMNSGAGHDAQNMAEKVRTGMIFVPSVDGISHSPLEWTHWEDIEKGAQVLTQSIKALSKD